MEKVGRSECENVGDGPLSRSSRSSKEPESVLEDVEHDAGNVEVVVRTSKLCSQSELGFLPFLFFVDEQEITESSGDLSGFPLHNCRLLPPTSRVPA